MRLRSQLTLRIHIIFSILEFLGVHLSQPSSNLHTAVLRVLCLNRLCLPQPALLKYPSPHTRIYNSITITYQQTSTMAGQGFRPGGIDDILRSLKPKNVNIPPVPEKAPEPFQGQHIVSSSHVYYLLRVMADVESGGIDKILAQLQPKKGLATKAPTGLRIPCARCKTFDLADMDPEYHKIRSLCPSCRQATNTGLHTSPPTAESCAQCGFNLIEMGRGYAAINILCPSCRREGRSITAVPVSGTTPSPFREPQAGTLWEVCS